MLCDYSITSALCPVVSAPSLRVLLALLLLN
jgi:hypothetical protein